MLYILQNGKGLNIAWNGRAPKKPSLLHWEELFPRITKSASRDSK